MLTIIYSEEWRKQNISLLLCPSRFSCGGPKLEITGVAMATWAQMIVFTHVWSQCVLPLGHPWKWGEACHTNGSPSQLGGMGGRQGCPAGNQESGHGTKKPSRELEAQPCHWLFALGHHFPFLWHGDAFYLRDGFLCWCCVFLFTILSLVLHIMPLLTGNSCLSSPWPCLYINIMLSRWHPQIFFFLLWGLVFQVLSSDHERLLSRVLEDWWRCISPPLTQSVGKKVTWIEK